MARPLGILMLDTAFERPVGDVGNSQSWPFPVLYERVSGASARKIVDGQDGDLLEAFVAAGEALISQGACALTTSCGFLILRQAELAARLSVPVGASSLLQLPQILAMLPPGKKAGVITYDETSLTLRHFQQAGLVEAPPVQGLPKGGRFHGLIEGGQAYDAEALADEVCQTVTLLLEREKDIGVLLFECTNLPPYSRLVSERFGLPVFDILTFGTWLHAGAAA